MQVNDIVRLRRTPLAVGKVVGTHPGYNRVTVAWATTAGGAPLRAYIMLVEDEADLEVIDDGN